MSDYERIAGIIRYLDAHHMEQPALSDLAAHVGLSSYHFHRLFSAWAGVTPKDFLQCLTLTHVRQQLCKGRNVLDVALSAGLSGPGRLHDLCIQFAAASPGELKTRGKGWTIEYGLGESPFGECILAVGPRGICHLAFIEREQVQIAELAEAWPEAVLTRNDSMAREYAQRIFRPSPGEGVPLRAMVNASDFRVRVWQALLKVPPGVLVSYQTLARTIGQPGAMRAVGSAVGANPLAFLIPCHRVIRETGVIGEYRWGSARKRLMIAWESVGRRLAGPPGAETQEAQESTK